MIDNLPVVVVGAGPIGLAAAAHLAEGGLEPLVLEAGDQAGAAVRQWGHVRLFSPWSQLIDPAAHRLLSPTGWRPPDPTAYPTGSDWATEYLDPLASVLGGRVRLGTRVVGVTRQGHDRAASTDRQSAPFTVQLGGRGGLPARIAARAVVDASGTWQTPNPLGADGLPAFGEPSAAGRISYRIPDLTTEAVRARYAGRHVAVVGSGHSAQTALLALVELAEQHPGTQVTWVLRRTRTGDLFGSGATDQLPARGALGRRAQAAVQAGAADLVTGFRTTGVERSDARIVLVADDDRRLGPVDEVVALTGLRPDLSWLSEVWLGLDARLQAPVALAPLIDPDVHTCGTVPVHGAGELTHPEHGFYLAGMKSYGRAPTFLAKTGYEQVRSIAAQLAGEHTAIQVEQVAPASAASLAEVSCEPADASREPAGASCAPGETASTACCAPAAPELVSLTRPGPADR